MVAILILTRSRRRWQAPNPKWVRASIRTQCALMPAICQLAGLKGQTPIMIDWSDLGRKRNWLFATVCCRKRGLPLLSWARTHDELNSSQNRLEAAFITRLLRNLPDAIRPAAGRSGLRTRQPAAVAIGNAPSHRPHGGLCNTAQGQCPHPNRRWLSGIAAEVSLASKSLCVSARIAVSFRWGGNGEPGAVLRGHRELWYLATSLPDAKVAARHYRQRMQPEQYLRAGKQYFT